MCHKWKQSSLHHDSITCSLARCLVYPRPVRDTPTTFASPIEVARAVLHLRLEHPVLHDETVAREVFFRASGSAERDNVGLDDGVVEAIDHWVDSNGEQVLVVVCVDIRSNSRTVWVGFVLASDIHLKNSGKTDLNFNVTVLIELIVPDVL